ncbi:hypothetical protein [Pyrobaculum sp.]|uniref:hypothetical protein n=1 Tax=Pyrobaculum sp. TaxID=2004705 RepID=UPI0031712DEA
MTLAHDPPSPNALLTDNTLSADTYQRPAEKAHLFVALFGRIRREGLRLSYATCLHAPV